MRFAVIGLAALTMLTAAASPAPRAVPIRPDTMIRWDTASGPAAYRLGQVMVTMERRRTGDLYAPVLTISSPGMAPVRIAAEPNHDSWGVRIGIGALRRGEMPSVVLNTYTGGTHCCRHIRAIVPSGGRWRVVDLDAWDGTELDWPHDVNGDGLADFQLQDSRFDYALGGYAAGLTPLQILNIRGGKAVDVSTEPGFAPLFRADRDAMAKDCFPARQAQACLAYAADEARLGRFDMALSRLRGTFTPKADADPSIWWACLESPPAWCRSTYTATLRAFLRHTGYIRR